MNSMDTFTHITESRERNEILQQSIALMEEQAFWMFVWKYVSHSQKQG